MAKKMNCKRAWSILRMALLWARKGGVFRRRLLVILKNHHNSSRRDRIRYGERQLSFDETPIFHRPASMRFAIPCINPPVDFDYDFEDDDAVYGYGDERRSVGGGGEESRECHVCDQESEIDLKAEEFIAKFYRQMKLQRQISYLQYTTEAQNKEIV